MLEGLIGRKEETPKNKLNLIYTNYIGVEIKSTSESGLVCCCIAHSQSPNIGILKTNCYNTPSSTSQYSLGRPQYEKILASRGRSIVTVIFQYSNIW